MHAQIGTPAGRAALRAFGVRMPERWDEPESPEEVIGKIAPTPVIIVHGTDDKLFPPSHAQRLYDAAGEPKRLLLGEGFGHAEDGLSPAFAHKLVERGRTNRWVGHGPGEAVRGAPRDADASRVEATGRTVGEVVDELSERYGERFASDRRRGLARRRTASARAGTR